MRFLSNLLKGWRIQRTHARKQRECKEFGHFMYKNGEGRPAVMMGGVPVETDEKASFWIYSCANKCGYHEANAPDLETPYIVSYALSESRRNNQ